MPSHTKALYAASAIALIKYGCMPEAHPPMWNTWLMPSTIVWLGLTGRHALWFDGITQDLPAAQDCPLCDLQPDACTGILTHGTSLTIAPRPTAPALSPRTAELSARCRIEHPEAWPLFDAELHAFEALHGPWYGNVDGAWEILRRTYIAAVEASHAAPSTARAREIQEDSGAVGAEFFYVLHDPHTGGRTARCSPTCSAAPTRISSGTPWDTVPRISQATGSTLTPEGRRRRPGRVTRPGRRRFEDLPTPRTRPAGCPAGSSRWTRSS